MDRISPIHIACFFYLTLGKSYGRFPCIWFVAAENTSSPVKRTGVTATCSASSSLISTSSAKSAYWVPISILPNFLNQIPNFTAKRLGQHDEVFYLGLVDILLPLLILLDGPKGHSGHLCKFSLAHPQLHPLGFQIGFRIGCPV